MHDNILPGMLGFRKLEPQENNLASGMSSLGLYFKAHKLSREQGQIVENGVISQINFLQWGVSSM